MLLCFASIQNVSAYGAFVESVEPEDPMKGVVLFQIHSDYQVQSGYPLKLLDELV